MVGNTHLYKNKLNQIKIQSFQEYLILSGEVIFVFLMSNILPNIGGTHFQPRDVVYVLVSFLVNIEENLKSKIVRRTWYKIYGLIMLCRSD